MSGAGGRPQPKHFKRRMIVGGGASGVGETAMEADDEQPPAPAADDNAAPANPATPPAKKPSKPRGGSSVSKA